MPSPKGARLGTQWMAAITVPGPIHSTGLLMVLSVPLAIFINHQLIESTTKIRFPEKIQANSLFLATPC